VIHLYEPEERFGSNELSEEIMWISNLLQDKEAAYGKSQLGQRTHHIPFGIPVSIHQLLLAELPVL